MDPWNVLNWLKDSSALRWVTLGLTSNKRENIPGLEVLHQPGETLIGNRHFNAVNFIFTNRTGQVVYLSGARLRECQEHFSIPPDAIRDISGWRELKFFNNNAGRFEDQEYTLHTGRSITTSIAVARQLDPAFQSYQPGWVSRWFRRPKYFLLQYTARVGDKTYSVETVY